MRIVINNKKISTYLLLRICKDIFCISNGLFVIIKNILLLCAIFVLLLGHFFSFIVYVIVALFIYCSLVLLRIVRVKVRCRSFFENDIYFMDTHIEWIGNKIEYEDIKRVIVKDSYIVIKSKRNFIIIVIDNNNALEVVKVQECLSIKCAESIQVSDKNKIRKRRIKKICLYGLFYGFVIYSVLQPIIEYPKILASQQKNFDVKYGIKLKVLEEESYTNYYTIERPYNRSIILKTIDKIDNILERFPSEFWDDIKDFERINIIVCDDIEPHNDKSNNAAGLTVNVRENIDVYIDSGIYNVDETIAHEMLHVMTNIIINKNELDLEPEKVVDSKQWNAFNAPEFIYGKNIEKYKKGFVTNYAKTSLSEDMAETFKFLVACNDKLPDEYNDEVVKNKALFLIEWIEDNFAGVTEDAYWNKWFK